MSKIRIRVMAGTYTIFKPGCEGKYPRLTVYVLVPI